MSVKTRLPAITLELTGACNLACSYCYNHWRVPGQELPDGRTPDYGQVRRTVKALYRQVDVRQIAMTGGEPFLFERLPEIALTCRLKGSAVAVISNGSIADRGRYDELIRIGIDLFEFPIHSATSAIHDSLTNTPGSWSKARESLEQVIELGARGVAVIVLTRRNVVGLGDTLRLCRELGVDSVMLNRFNIGGRGIAEAHRLQPDAAQLHQSLRVADTAVTELGLKISSNVCTPHCLVDPHDYPRLGFSNCEVDVRQRPLTLNWRGDLRFCNHSPVIMGNIHRQSLNEIFASDYATLWRQARPVFCADCHRFERCAGGCRAAAEQLGGTPADPDPVLEMSGTKAPGSA
ncbi:MAG: radical SAM protein [bacterium]|nr:radical SAM protein [bacterium]